MSPIPARILFIAAAAIALLVPATLHAYVPEWARRADIAETHVGKLQSGDFNGDGKQDLVVRTYMNGGGAVRLRLATPGFTFAAPQVLISSSTLTSSAVADVTSDGRVDVLAADAFTLSVLPSNGDGTFGAAIVTNLPAAAWQIVTGDFNGDHQIDVALHTTGRVTILAGDGTGHFAEISHFDLTGDVMREVAGDIDGDGKTDLLIERSSPNDYQLYYGKGDGSFDDPATVSRPTASSWDVILADLSGDGRQRSSPRRSTPTPSRST